MKLSALLFANASGTAGAILWVACALIALVFPDLYRAGANLLSFGNFGHFNLSLNSAVLGGVLFTVISWVSGYVFGWSLEKFSKK